MLMRMRKRHNLEPRMEKCADFLIEDALERRDHWRDIMPGCEKLSLELGCGKGRFTADTAEGLPTTLFIAVEKVADAMIIAMERIRDRGIGNVRFICEDVAKLTEMFGKGETDRIYINFCDPWPKSRDAKFRLTAPSFLRMYSHIMPVGGQIHFKTDNRPLFDWSLEQFKGEGWEISELTNDLHRDGINGVMTDYEAKFHAEGIKINRLVATKTAATLDISAGTPPRLHNSALRDFIGYEESKDANAQGGSGEN